MSAIGVVTGAREALARRLRAVREADGTESTRFLTKWIFLAVLIGIVAGVGAIVFYEAIRLVSHYALGVVAGVYPPSPAGEGGDTTVRAFARPWLVPLVTTLGGLISGVLVFTLAPEAEGHGTDAAIASFHYRAGQVRARIAPIKLIASAITIGSGGSAGREGPTAQISASFGSLLASLLGLSATDRRLCVAVGMGAGIGAIFRAPLGGAMLAAEILYVHDLEAEAIIPALIASIVGYAIFGSFTGFEPIFGTQGNIVFNNPVQLLYFAALGLLCGLVGITYARGFYGIERLFRRLRLPRAVKPALGGLLVGLIALALPQVLGTGYGWVQIGMSQQLLTLPLWIVVLLPFARILATGLSISSGGSGGIFGPGMVIGGMLGAAFWRLTYGWLPGMPNEPASFTIVAMMALFGGIAHAPLAVMIMVAEMTGNLTLLAPAMVAVGLATLLVGNNTIYRSQLGSRADSPAHRYQFTLPLLATLTVADALEPAPLTFTPDESLAHAAERLRAASATGVTGGPVLDNAGHIAGVLTAGDLTRRSLPTDAEVRAAMSAPKLRLDRSQALDDTLDTLVADHLSWAPVLDETSGRVAGLVSVAGILQAYKVGIGRTVRRAAGIAPGSVLLEAVVTPGSPLLGQPLRAALLPPETLLITCRREGVVLLPHGDTEFQPGDVLTIVTARDREADVRQYFGGGVRDETAAPS
ncbi:MAG TPA: chloride channel protein [Thermomicrobiales bacterium]|nr:chloride channel protein [Thermomicrobiales bacterium]